MTNQLAQLKQLIESRHWNWRSESNSPGDIAQFTQGRYTFRIYAGHLVRKMSGDSELEAAQGAYEEICEALAMKGGK